jgi:hypothetical protein
MRALVCVTCHCELERTEIAGGHAVVHCVACRVVGDEGDYVAGARLAEMPQEPQAARYAAALGADWFR